MVFFGRVRLELEVGEDRSEKEPRAELARDEVGVLALPADPGALCERLLHQGRRVDEHLDVGRFGFGRSDEMRRERFQLALDDVVVVAIAGVDRNRAAGLSRERRQRILLRAVVEAEDDKAFRPRHERPRVDAPLKGLRHPAHLAVRALGEPGGEPLAHLRRRIGGGHPAGVEAERVRLGLEGGREALCARRTTHGRAGPRRAFGRPPPVRRRRSFRTPFGDDRSGAGSRRECRMRRR